MGIKRCPYCRSLISDQDQYCKNCGTQLLFPEDEEIEEEIPGDKIIEDDRDKEETEDLTEEELEEEHDEDEEDEDEEEEEEKSEVILVEEDTTTLEEAGTKKLTSRAAREVRAEESLFSEEEKLPFPGDRTREIGREEETGGQKTEEYLIEGLKKEVLSGGESGPEQPAASGPGMVTRMVEELAREQEKKEAPGQKPTSDQPGVVTRMVKELGLKEERKATESYEIEAEEDLPASATFQSAELDIIGATAELGRREVEDFFRVLEEKEKEHLKEKIESDKTEKIETSGVPSWIQEVKTASTEILAGREETKEDREPEKMDSETDELWLGEEETPTEPTMGFPERLTRSEPELAGPEEETPEELAMELEAEREDTEWPTTEEIVKKTPVSPLGRTGLEARNQQAADGRTLPPLGFKNFVKAKVFDLLFLVMFWLMSIWIAARSMQTTIFKLLGLASSGLLIYLLILVFFYFFLFYFFVGETLGDRLFRESEEEGSL